MKRFAVLAAALTLVLVACQTPAAPGEVSPPPPPESSSSTTDRPTVQEPPSSGEIPAESPASGSSESEAPDPGPIPQPVLTVSPGVDCKTLLTWDSTQKKITIGPLCLENKQLLLETAGDQRKALGLDLATGSIDFTLPLEEDSYLREVLGEPGEFLVMGKTGCRHFVWREDGWLGEYPAYDLPDQAREAMDFYDFQKCHFLWDYLPRENLLAWTQGDGIWLSALDGSNARLAIPAKEVFSHPEFDPITENEYYRKYFGLSDPNTDTGPLLVEPRFMADGKILTASAYFLSALSDDFCHEYGLEILDISTGERAWHKREHLLVGSYKFLDPSSLVLEYDRIDVVHKTKEPFYLEHGYEWPAGRSYSADGLHFFGRTGDDDTTRLVRYTWDGRDELCTPEREYQQGRAQALISLTHAWLQYPTPLDRRRTLCTYCPADRSDPKETLLLITALEI